MPLGFSGAHDAPLQITIMVTTHNMNVRIETNTHVPINQRILASGVDGAESCECNMVESAWEKKNGRKTQQETKMLKTCDDHHCERNCCKAVLE